MSDLNVLPTNGEPGVRCRSLRCKGMYLNYGLAPADRVTGDGHFWCSKNQKVYGPDDQLVGDLPCRDSSRTCYEA
ncbi:MAG: hypothetical protein ACKOGA_07000 [Planctomycetaceae bacterium]